MVSPRLTIFISGLTRWLTETCAKPAASRQRRRPRLVRLVAVAVHEDDGAGAEPRRPRLGQRRRQMRLVERHLHGAVRPHPLAASITRA